MAHRRWIKRMFVILIALCVFVVAFYLLQRFFAHRNGYFSPDYAKVELTKESDYETIFLQTGLGRAATDKLLKQNDFQTVLEIQSIFFQTPKVSCQPLLEWFTREDKLVDEGKIPLVDLQAGDILITLSTHTGGWRHGHAGLVIDENTVLECTVLGEESDVMDVEHWTEYSNVAVLRLKEITPSLQQEVVKYSLENLKDVPYHLTSGWIGPKAPEPEDWQFGLHCSYLVWYAWEHFGFDLDSDGGRLVSSYDILHSDELEIVQLYGMDPREFLTE